MQLAVRRSGYRKQQRPETCANRPGQMSQTINQERRIVMTKEKSQTGQNPVKPFPVTGVPEVAAHFSVAERTVFNWMAAKRIPYFKIGGKVRFDLEVVDKHVREKCLVKAK
jgi:excisionase family DNA binding protein